jgi:hypothetical protein
MIQQRTAAMTARANTAAASARLNDVATAAGISAGIAGSCGALRSVRAEPASRQA